MKTKSIHLKSLPAGWYDLSIRQWEQLEAIRGKYISTTAYLATCFLLFEGLTPLRHAERWRELLASLPLMGRFVRMTGRRVCGREEDYLGFDSRLLWGQCYRDKGLWGLLFGRRFWMNDREVYGFQQKIKFLLDEPVLMGNTVKSVRVGVKRYYSHYVRLSDMTWRDYNLCNMYLDKYRKTKKPVYLDNFLAILYHVYSAHPMAAKFSELELRLILVFWESVQKDFARTFPLLFKKSHKSDPKETNYMQQEAEVTVFISRLAYTMPEAVRKMMAYDALQYLQFNAAEVEAREKSLNELKSKNRA